MLPKELKPRVRFEALAATFCKGSTASSRAMTSATSLVELACGRPKLHVQFTQTRSHRTQWLSNGLWNDVRMAVWGYLPAIGGSWTVHVRGHAEKSESPTKNSTPATCINKNNLQLTSEILIHMPRSLPLERPVYQYVSRALNAFATNSH